MFCRNCGAPVEDSLNFCSSCGTKVDEPIGTSNFSTNNVNTVTSRDFVGDLKNGFNEFINFTTAVLKTPTMAFEKVNCYLTEKKALVYTAIFGIFYGIIQCILLKILFNAMENAINGLINQIFFGFGDGTENGFYRIHPNWFKLFLLNALFIIMFLLIFSLISFVTYKLIMKKNVELIDFVKVYLSSLVILVVGSIFVMIAAIISLKIMLAVTLIGVVLYLITLAINFVNYLGNETKVIYSLPVIISMSLFISYCMCFKIMY